MTASRAARTASGEPDRPCASPKASTSDRRAVTTGSPSRTDHPGPVVRWTRSHGGTGGAWRLRPTATRVLAPG